MTSDKFESPTLQTVPETLTLATTCPSISGVLPPERRPVPPIGRHPLGRPPSSQAVAWGAPRRERRGAPRLHHALRKKREAAVILAREEDVTRRAARDRLGEVTLRRGAHAGAWRTCGCVGRADRECRGFHGVKFDQCRLLPTRAPQIGWVALAEAVAHVDRQHERRPHTTVRRFHGLAVLRLERGRVLFCVACAIPAFVGTGAGQVQSDAALNAKVCVA